MIPTSGTTLTFTGLFEQVSLVQIPVLQRDYAQGREAEHSVRNTFLEALRTCLSAEPPGQPLDLDFIYGSMEAGEPPVFSVLDGQQRLTTFFLLHWYLALKEEKLETFRAILLYNGKSRFTYKTRVSATEFFNALANATDIQLPQAPQKLSDAIQDRQWFFSSWTQDPTVQGCLTMLDAMHALFQDEPPVLYTRLTCRETPRILFQFLDLKEFSLSDELYIKMNGRGKILSDFENFKASFSSSLKDVSNGQDLALKIDGTWTDLFWKLTEGKTDKFKNRTERFNALYLRFFRLMAFYRACEHAASPADKTAKNNHDFPSRVRDATKDIPHTLPNGSRLFDAQALTQIESILDYCAIPPQSEDGNANALQQAARSLLKDVLEKDSVLAESRFYALICLIQTTGNPTATHFWRWQRVTDNLLHNRNIDSVATFLPLVRSLPELAEQGENLYAFLSTAGDAPSGFTKTQGTDQWSEEKRKCRLILCNPQWEPLLQHGAWQPDAQHPAYESHPYLMGQVGFVLDMPDPTAPDGEASKTPDREVFRKNVTVVCALLEDSLLKSREFLLQRALLSMGDYTLHHSDEKYSLCKLNHTSWSEREKTWLKVAKTPLFARLVARLIIEGTGDIQQDLRRIIEAYQDKSGWRYLMVKYPETFAYCGEYLIGKEKVTGEQADIYLLTRQRYSGYYTNLKTYVSGIILKNLEAENALPPEIETSHFCPVCQNRGGFLGIILTNGQIYRLRYQPFRFDSRLVTGENEESPEPVTPEVIKNFLKNYFPHEAIAA